MEPQRLEELIAEHLGRFYEKRIKKLQSMKLKQYLKRKNPYLFRATGTQKAGEIVDEMMLAYLSSSDETIFGNEFFEPLAKLAAEGGTSGSQGVDVVIETPAKYVAISVKSGPNPFNSSQKKRQNDEFMELNSRLQKLHKQFDPVLGHCYGQRKCAPSAKQIYREVSGQEFWLELTGDGDFYLKIIRLMKDIPQEHRPLYKKAWDEAANRLTLDFIQSFCRKDGSIDWEKLAQFNSGMRVGIQ